MGTLWHSHTSIHCDATLGYLENLQLWTQETLLPEALRHLETFCCSSAWHATGNSETFSPDHLPTETTIHICLLLSHHAANGEGVLFLHFCIPCSGMGHNFSQVLKPIWRFLKSSTQIWHAWRGQGPLRNLLPSQLSSLPLWMLLFQRNFSSLEHGNHWLLSSEIFPYPLSYIH